MLGIAVSKIQRALDLRRLDGRRAGWVMRCPPAWGGVEGVGSRGLFGTGGVYAQPDYRPEP